ncbi:MAG: LPS export ABC transporter permease LptG [Deltaproteobacteria bacterium]|nr:LPS export ABC transporter permease LptG [Deltaproteobacteria bacterium]
MSILSRYLCREFFKLLILCQIIFLSIYLIIDFLQKIDNLIEANVSKSVMFSYFFYKTPYIMVQMAPVATLISVIIMFCLMKKNNEIMAMKSCGLDILKISQIIIVLSLLVGLTVFLFSEIIVPYASSRSNDIWSIEVNKQDPTRFYGSNQIWYKGSDSIYWIKNFDSEKGIMENPTFYFFDKAFRLIKRIDGRRGIWQDGIWKIEEGIMQEAQDDKVYKLSKFDELYLEIPETPETFVRDVKLPEDMSYRELKRYSKRIRQEGYDNTRYLVDMNLKIAFPFISFIMVLVGIPIALGLKKGGIPLAVSVGIGGCFLYMITLSFSRSLGLSGIFPPALSAWAANLIFFFFGLYLMMNIER